MRGGLSTIFFSGQFWYHQESFEIVWTALKPFSTIGTNPRAKKGVPGFFFAKTLSLSVALFTIYSAVPTRSERSNSFHFYQVSQIEFSLKLAGQAPTPWNDSSSTRVVHHGRDPVEHGQRDGEHQKKRGSHERELGPLQEGPRCLGLEEEDLDLQPHQRSAQSPEFSAIQNHLRQPKPPGWKQAVAIEKKSNSLHSL